MIGIKADVFFPAVVNRERKISAGRRFVSQLNQIDLL